MSNNNDQRILELKKQIQIKKEKLSKSSRFTPITNCSLELDGTRYNLNVLIKEGLTTLLVKLNMYLLSVKDLRLTEEYKISGYKIEEWITDIKNKIDILSRKEEEKNLKTMENKLESLLSDGKKVELELNAIADILKE